MRNDEDKPGFLDGIWAGLEGKQRDADSPQVEEIKNFIRSKELTTGERGDLAGWLMGEAFKNMVISGLGDDPTTR